ncbi:hypothetical protein DJ522_08620 [Sulfolobus sp. F3]|nr:hypothetical protein DJ522_08620 [Sulfolobus sp. F3]
MDQEAAKELLLKAASGVKTTIITSDKNWAGWLSVQREVYKKDEEAKLNSELSNAQRTYNRLIYLGVIISVLIVIADVMIYFILNMQHMVLNIYYIVLLSVVAILLINYYAFKRRKQMISQINILRENLQNLMQEVNQVRNKIKEKLNVIQIDKKVSFSILSCDEKVILFSAPFVISDLVNSIHVVMEVSKDFVLSKILPKDSQNI